jgi:hypothetical protein
MGTGLFSVTRGIAGILGVALSATYLEHQRTVHAMWLAQEQDETPAQWTLSDLQQLFTGLGDVSSEAQIKAAAHLHSMMQAEATVVAYQDVFMLSAFLSLFNVLPSLLQRRASRRRPATPQEQQDMPAEQPLSASKKA